MNEALGPFRMATLMFLSGLLLPASMRKSKKTYLDGKLRLIAWPWLVWTLLYCLVLLAGRTFAGTPLRVQEIVLNVLLLETYTWFLFFLFCNYMLALVLRRFPQPLIIIAALVLAALAKDGSVVERFFYLLAFFLVGDLTSRRDLLGRLHLERPVPLLIFAIVASLPVVYVILGGNPRYDPAWSLATMGGICLFIGAAQVLTPWPGARALRYIGKNSLKFYVMHVVAMVVILRVLLILSNFAPELLVLTTMVASLSVCWIASRVSERKRWVRILFMLPPIEEKKTRR